MVLMWLSKFLFSYFPPRQIVRDEPWRMDGGGSSPAIWRERIIWQKMFPPLQNQPLKSLTPFGFGKVWGVTKNFRAVTKILPLRRFPTVGIVRKVPSTQHNSPHKHHHHGGTVCPYYGVISVDLPDRTRATSSEGVGRGRLCWMLHKSFK